MRLSLFLLAVTAFPLLAAEPLTLNLWPGKAPGDPESLAPEKVEPADVAKKTVMKISNVSVPQLAVYLPAKEKASGGFVLVAPGGGYSILAYEHEGTDVAKWLNDLGIAAGVLKYRVPKRKDVSPEYQPMLQDAQRALGLVRSKAKDWNVDDHKIGMLGFSAGGHLTAAASIMYSKRMYEMIDDADKLSCKPDFAVLIYPGGLVEKDTEILKPEFVVTKETPPMFFVHASNDSSENSIALYRALKKASVPAELHLYASGGHGFGLKKNDWPKRCEEWLRQRSIMK
jgi:acetyl esterase/lipase